MLTQVLDSLVATGTLALAGGTVVLAYQAREGIKESAKTRADLRSHSLFVRGVSLSDTVSTPALTAAHLGEGEPGALWDLTQHGNTPLGLSVYVRIVNEGTASALIKADHPDSVDHVEFTIASDEPRIVPVPTVNLPDESGWAFLPPGQAVALRCVWWRTASEWAADWSRTDRPPTVDVTLRARDPRHSVEDGTVITVGRFVLAPIPTRDGWRLLGNEIDPAMPTAPPVAEVGIVERCYA